MFHAIVANSTRVLLGTLDTIVPSPNLGTLLKRSIAANEDSYAKKRKLIEASNFIARRIQD